MNGKDVSNLAHEDAVSEFLRADEPIVVEVKRRDTQPIQQSTSNSTDIRSGMNAVTPTSDMPATNQLSSEKFGSTKLDKEQKSNETTSVAIQTELMLCDFDSEYICQRNESPIRVEHHLNGGEINHSGQHNGNNNNNNNGLHHSLHHCATLLNDCIVPPEIDIEVSVLIYRYAQHTIIAK